eukprot:CAMPEP_0185158932 /NCGR_PEP_ID=MMETSP1139-20130426/2717_1 /TAXON_ID=298111 /ORGANISM="Pavlova sp., Strain CCMP459" /LENGTH=823 /DNA_ID=CAMNT_0027724089 /DNA_START=18 /DNA_END=2489 /DNA_ORIENTATION=+
MSVIGIDVGTESCVVAIARRGGVDVLANETSNRTTPCMVGFSGKERRVGEQAKAGITSNIKNTVVGLKKLIGKRYNSEAIQTELKFATFGMRDVAGEAQLQFNYDGEQRTWRVERVMGMVLQHMRQIAEAGNDGKPITDCVISIPPYWTDAERVAMAHSCEVVGLNVLKLMHDSSAAALSYGIYKTELPEEDKALNVMIFDLGHGDCTVSVVAFSKGKLVVKSVASETVGARDMDMEVAKHCAAAWKEKHKIDAFSTPKAVFRLMTACEKLRKTLSTIAQSTLAIECFIDDIDVQQKIERSDFEEWNKPILDRIMATVDKALSEAGIAKDQLHTCEVIGGGSRIPCVANSLKEWLGKDVSRTLNQEESVARGCALQGAMLSPAFRVRDFSINEVYNYPINISWANQAGDGEAVSMETDEAADSAATAAPAGGSKPGGSEIFSRFNSMPCTKMLTLYRNSTFQLAASYPEDAPTPAGTVSKISDFTISGLPLGAKPGDAPPPADAPKYKCKVKVRLDANGILVVESAQAIEEKEVEFWEDAPAAPAADGAAAAPAADGAPAAEPVQPAQVKKVKKKTERHNLPVEALRPLNMTKRELLDAREEEGKMAIQDRILVETAEKMNALESYVYSMRDKLQTSLKEYATEAEASNLISKLDETENWLYEDGADADKTTYEQKHNMLLDLCSPVNQRLVEAESRAPAVSELEKVIASMESLAASAATEHIEPADKDKALSEVSAAKAWLAAEQEKQAALPKHADPTLLTAQIDGKRASVETACAVLKKPKPAPKPAAVPPAAAPATAMDTDAAAPAAAAAAPAAVDMDLD